MMMVKKHSPWWTNRDGLWGGETLESDEDKPNIGIKKGDLFRVEKQGVSVRLIPHPDNDGDWQVTHSKSNPIRLRRKQTKNHKRAFSMEVTRPTNQGAMTFYLVERNDGSAAITSLDPDDPRANGSTASIRR